MGSKKNSQPGHPLWVAPEAQLSPFTKLVSSALPCEQHRFQERHAKVTTITKGHFYLGKAPGKVSTILEPKPSFWGFLVFLAAGHRDSRCLSFFFRLPLPTLPLEVYPQNCGVWCKPQCFPSLLPP